MTNIFTENARPVYTRIWKQWLNAAKTDEFAKHRVELYQFRPAEELYDSEADPYELNNLADNPEFEPVLERMRGIMDEWMTQQGDKGIVTEKEPLRIQGDILERRKRAAQEKKKQQAEQ